MLICFDKIEDEVNKNFRGGEKNTVVKKFADDNNLIMQIKLEPGASIGLHKHETDSEIVYILQGKGRVLYDDGQEELKIGVCHYCPKGHSHSMMNDGTEDLIFLAIVPQQ